jgi:hypothetical protein
MVEYNNLIPSIKVECLIIPEYVLKNKKKNPFTNTTKPYLVIGFRVL